MIGAPQVPPSTDNHHNDTDYAYPDPPTFPDPPGFRDSPYPDTQIPDQYPFSQRNRRARRCLGFFKKFVAFLFSQIGLCVLVVAYSIMGGFVFQELEAEYERSQKTTVAITRLRHVERLWNVTVRLNILYKPNWTILANEILLDFQQEIHKAIQEKGWDGEEGEELQWTFAGALLYSVTVITTIGYGHIAPKTPRGRIVTIFYAVVGIPLTLLCLTNIGGVLADIFRFLYKRVCCGLCCICVRTNQPRPQRNTGTLKSNISRDLDSNSIRSDSLNRKPPPSKPMTLDVDFCELNQDDKSLDLATTPLNTAQQCVQDQPKKKKPLEKVTVPISLTLFIMAAYICSGAMLFSLWEEDWDYLIGSYFVFVTLSTIGFGDFVPGDMGGSSSSQEKQILCTLYLMFGLAFVAMCFELMQEEVRAKVRWLGEKMGLLTSQN